MRIAQYGVTTGVLPAYSIFHYGDLIGLTDCRDIKEKT